ncbi:MAG: MbnP family protein [Flavobacteriales bacterium]
MKNILTIISLVSIILVSCEKPTKTNLTINFSHTVEGANLTTNSMVYTNDAGENYNVQTLKYLISDITLHAENGSSLVLDEVHFIDISEESTFSFTYNDVPNNNYTSISFDMGLDTNKNISNKYVDEGIGTNQEFHQTMFWPEIGMNGMDMGGGYHYMKLEGDFNDSLSGYGTHTGGTMGMDYSFNNIDGISLIVTDDLGNVDVNINMEINNWYRTPNQIEFSTYGMGIMGNMQMQMNLKENGMTDVFSISVNK